MRIKRYTWIKFWSTFLLGLVLSMADGQNQECILVHFDKSFYVAGETIWFKAYLAGDSGQVRSRVLHVDLINHQNSIVTTQKLLVNYQSSFGSITLPLEGEEGYYRFRAYTYYNLSFDPAFVYEATIPVYRSAQNPSPTVPSPSDSTHLHTNSKGPQEVTIHIDEKAYLPRDSLTITLEINRMLTEDRPEISRGNLSVSVIPLDLLDTQPLSDNASQCGNTVLKQDQPVDLQRSLYLEGRLLDPLTKSEAESKLITIYMDQAAELIKAYSHQGKIKIPVYDYWGTGVFQLLNLDPYNPSEFEFEAHQGSRVTTPYYNSQPPKRTPSVLKYLEQLEKRRKIKELFNQYNLGEIKYLRPPDIVSDAVYRIEDYTDIHSLEEFINEAILNVRVRTINGFKTIRLFNREEGDLFPQHPWYFVDGFITFNEKEALDIAYQDIVEVRLYSKTSTLKKYFSHFMWNCGVVEIITRDVKYLRKLKDHPNVVEIEGFSRAQNFNNTFTQSPNWTTPDLRGVMYWAPNIFTNSEGMSQLTIPLSDDTGKFAVVVKGIADSKRVISGFSTFEVKSKQTKSE